MRARAVRPCAPSQENMSSKQRKTHIFWETPDFLNDGELHKAKPGDMLVQRSLGYAVLLALVS